MAIDVKTIEFKDVPEGHRSRIIALLIERLGVEIVVESTPDYTSYELRDKRTVFG